MVMLNLQIVVSGDGPQRTVRLVDAHPQELVDALRAKARDLEREYEPMSSRTCAYGHSLED